MHVLYRYVNANVCVCVCLVTCHLITLHDGTAYNSVELVWNSEPKDIGESLTDT